MLIALFLSPGLAGEEKPGTAEIWPEPLVRENGVQGFRSWEDIYARMGMTRAWAEEKPQDGSWETAGLLEEALEGPMAGVEEVVFAIRKAGGDWHWYANFGYHVNDADYYYHSDGAQLAVLNLRTAEVRVLVDDPGGTIRDPCVDYDGRRILFSYRPAGSTSFHLYTIQADGTDLTQLTDGPFDDIEPTWTPAGDILFCSSRARRWVPCYKSQVAILYKCDGDGSNVRPISCNAETENTPWMMPDGRVLFTRWEYVDRDQDMSYHHLWTMNPDGTNVMTYMGNQFSGMLLIDAKPVPGSDKVVASVCPGHGRNEHMGAVGLIDAGRGPDDLSLSRLVSRPEPDRPRFGFGNDPHRWRDPWAFSEDCFLVARSRDLCIMDGQGRYETIYSLPEEFPPPEDEGERRVFMAHEPRPLIARPREPVQADRTDPARVTGEFVLADVTKGRSMEGVARREVKDLLVLEVLPKPVNYFGGADIVASWPTYFLYRVLGTVPVEPDGSAYFEAPALRPLFFVARDEKGLGIKRMRSFTHVMPGETLGCVGCHEKRSRTPDKPFTLALAALERPPSMITPPPPEIPEVFDFPRDIQPILDRHCVECHGIPRFDAGFSLSGDRGTEFSHAYSNLFRLGLVQIRSPVGNHPPRTDGSSASPLLKYFAPSHHDVTPTEEELRMIRTWIDAGAPYAGTYSALGNGMVFYKFPEEDVLTRRCVSCHAPDSEKPEFRKIFTKHMLNLTHAEKSLMLLAPLSREAGGLGLCRDRTLQEEPEIEAPRAQVFASRDDPDFQALAANMREMARWLQEDITSFEFDTFRPSEGYFREMRRYGILPRDFDPQTDPITPYEWDQAYWRLFHLAADQP